MLNQVLLCPCASPHAELTKCGRHIFWKHVHHRTCFNCHVTLKNTKKIIVSIKRPALNGIASVYRLYRAENGWGTGVIKWLSSRFFSWKTSSHGEKNFGLPHVSHVLFRRWPEIVFQWILNTTIQYFKMPRKCNVVVIGHSFREGWKDYAPTCTTRTGITWDWEKTHT